MGAPYERLPTALLQISQSGYARIAPPSSSPVPRGEDGLPPLQPVLSPVEGAGGTEGGRVACILPCFYQTGNHEFVAVQGTLKTELSSIETLREQ